jgi:hypothetical protein
MLLFCCCATYPHALQVKSDVRMIVSKMYAAEYSLRFPRVEEVRMDKDAFCVNTDQELREQVLAKQGSLADFKAQVTEGAGDGELPPGMRRGRKGVRKGGRKGQEGAPRGGVVTHLMPADVSGEQTGLAGALLLMAKGHVGVCGAVL